MASQFVLMGQKRFLPFFISQFLGALNDNVFKFALTALATWSAARWGGLAPSQGAAVIGGLFVLPFALFSAQAGQLADKFDKAVLTRRVKEFEIVALGVGSAGFLLHRPALAFGAVFLMGMHSALFGPVKYAYLPQHLKESELTGGNGLVEMGTFVAILMGNMLGGMLSAGGEESLMALCAVTMSLALLGRIAAGFVPQSPAPAPELKFNWNPVSETIANIRVARKTRSVFLSMLGISWLWFFGASFLASIAGLCKEVIGGDSSVASALLGVFSVGIALGALACERLSDRKVEIGLVPFGSIGMSLFALDFWWTLKGVSPGAGLAGALEFMRAPGSMHLMIDLFGLSFFSGLYSVPLYALIQTRSEKSHQARIIAANNIMNALFMVASALFGMLLSSMGVGLVDLFLGLAVLNALVAAYIYTLVPEFLMRFIAWILTHAVWRVEKIDLSNIPETGPCVVVCNHMSFADAIVLMGCSPRPIRFIMDHKIFKFWLLRFVFKTSRAIPIASAKVDSALMEKAFEEASAALKNGEVVGIFPEGRITESGEMNPFRPGVERIIARDPAPVVPMALSGMWGSFFSRKAGQAMSDLKSIRIWRKIRLSVGVPFAPEDVSAGKLQEEVLRLRGDWK